MTQLEILGASVSKMDMVETVCTVAACIDSGRSKIEDGENPVHFIVTLNAEILYKAQTDEKLMSIIQSADLITADGTGIVIAAQKLCHEEIVRVTGIDLMQELCRQSSPSGWSCYLFGAAPTVAEQAKAALEEKYNTNVCGTHDGFFKDEDVKGIVKEINKAKPDILFVALGSPKQDLWIAANRDKLNVPVIIGVGGCFDVIAGNVKRAPEFFQRAGLEWLWRLLKEPWRFKRMLSLPKFLVLVYKEAHAQNKKAAAAKKEIAKNNQEKKEKKLPK